MRVRHFLVLSLAAAAWQLLSAPQPAEAPANLVRNGDFEKRADAKSPVGYELSGSAGYGYLGDHSNNRSSLGVWLDSSSPVASVAQSVSGIDAREGRWFRFSFRGLPQKSFAVADDDLGMKVEFFGDHGKVSYDAKTRSLYRRIQRDRRDFAANGRGGQGGAETWRTYEMEFYLPFPQVTDLRVSVGFAHGSGTAPESSFYVDDFALERIAAPAEPATRAATRPAPVAPDAILVPLGGRWFYAAKKADEKPPATFDASNADRLIYKDARCSAPFAGNMTAWLRAGDLDASGNVVRADRLVADNVTVRFDDRSLVIRTHGLPNHPTGRFPADDFSDDPNPNYIQDRVATWYIPLNPAENPHHQVTAVDNSNHALPMGPIGIALNGVVFFNPFDAGNQDASDLMDRCCGHPNPMNLYHYHKYPICIHSPWADEGLAHSPLIGFAFDGYPVYGPYEDTDHMAKDLTGSNALNRFNMHFDADRGWHYHVTPGKFPYLIGGYWGSEDPRDMRRSPRRPPE